MRKIIRDELAELCAHMTSLGIDCKTIDKKEAPMKLSRWSGKRCIVVEARNFEVVCVLKQSSQHSSTITVQYVVAGKKEQGKDLKADLMIKKRGVMRRELEDIRWRGFYLAELLEYDSELKERLTDIVRKRELPGMRIRYNEKMESTVISTTYQGYRIKMMPSVELLNAYDRIARHVKEVY
jgi:hypothetical protein